MSLRQTMGEYLYKLKPVVDSSEWKKATGSIDAMMEKSTVKYEDYKDKLADLQKTKKEIALMERKIAELKRMAEGGNATAMRMLTSDEPGNQGYLAQLGELETKRDELQVETEMMSHLLDKNEVNAVKGAESMGKFIGWIKAAGGSVMAFVGVIKEGIEKANEVLEAASKYSNKLGIGANSIFYDSEQRGLMTRYGMSSSQAAASSSVSEVLGYDLSTRGTWTVAQKKAYDELMGVYQEGIDKIDTKKLEDYYDKMQEYQLAVSKYKLQLQSTITKLFAESSTFDGLMDSVEKFMEETIDFLNTDAVQWFFDAFLGFLEGIVDFASGFMDFAGGLFGGGGTTNNKTNNVKNTYNIYGSDYSSNDALARSIALKSDRALEG